MSIRPKLSSLVSKQLPSFIQDDYQTFVAFLESYYAYLETNVKDDYKSLMDVDTTLDSFIQYFRRELSNFTHNAITDERFLLQHIKEYYSSKGSESSYKFLFRVLYGLEVELKYPRNNILKTSDGRWNQDLSIILSQDEGDVYDILGQVITVNTSTQTFNVFVNRIKLSDDKYEVFLDKFYYGTLSVGDILSYGTFVGTVQPSVSKVSIVKSGTGFKVGQVYDISSEIGTGTRVKVTKVGDNGELKSLQIIKFGTGYSTDFYSSIISGYDSVNVIIDQFNHSSQTGGFIDSGKITIKSYFLGDYTQEDYNGEILRTFYTDATVPQTGSFDDEKTAVIKLSLGSIQKYPGYYTTVNGFLSDDMYLQDSRFYQINSYVLKVNKSIEEYRSIIKSLVHPAGTALFGEYSLSNSFDLSASVELLIRFIGLDHVDSVNVATESLSSLINKSLIEVVNVSELNYRNINKPFTDSSTALDSGSVRFDGYFLEDYALDYSSLTTIIRTF